ncbi:unnamed protein product [Cylindrotheca closterium]|uniref:Carbohydrate-binding domain-containing protein n=1 Tax=Cylindrotheca closterium TaxID=2856 RepID=A0AAD2FFP3_9STRA|nr:unnamed protein product [Cylindrotheca closterium]
MLSSSNSHSTQSPLRPHWELYPRSYVAQKTSFPLIDHMDGDLDKDVWSNVPWSDDFDDIRGPKDAPSDERPDANCRTRFKALWDDDYLYFGAMIESDFTTEAHFTERNSPIYHLDSDFEVFVDPFGECWNYKEFEMNAINTVWNLMLDKPYADHGHEHSGRIAKPGDDDYYEVNNQKSATKIIRGKLNDANGGATWSVEIAMSHKDLLFHTLNPSKVPVPGSMWRVNFSRVEHKGKINWTWQPQIAWDAKQLRNTGYVDMHRPDAWGYLVFGDETEETIKFEMQKDPTWPLRLAAMNVYYAQRAHQEAKEKYASKMSELLQNLNIAIVDPFDVDIKCDVDGYTAVVTGNGYVVSVNQDRLIKVEDAISASEKL